MYGVFQRKLIRPQQQGKWLRKYQNQNGNGDTDHRQRYQILRKKRVGALTYYLYERGLVAPETENLFLQGEHMGRPSRIRSRLMEKDGTVKVRIGGQAVMSLAGEMDL